MSSSWVIFFRSQSLLKWWCAVWKRQDGPNKRCSWVSLRELLDLHPHGARNQKSVFLLPRVWWSVSCDSLSLFHKSRWATPLNLTLICFSVELLSLINSTVDNLPGLQYFPSFKHAVIAMHRYYSEDLAFLIARPFNFVSGTFG